MSLLVEPATRPAAPVLSSPSEIQAELEVLRREIALKSNDFDDATEKWFQVQPIKEQIWAQVYVQTDGPAHVRKAAATGATAKTDWGEREGRYIALKAKLRALEAQAVICQSLLKQARFV